MKYAGLICIHNHYGDLIFRFFLRKQLLSVNALHTVILPQLPRKQSWCDTCACHIVRGAELKKGFCHRDDFTNRAIASSFSLPAQELTITSRSEPSKLIFSPKAVQMPPTSPLSTKVVPRGRLPSLRLSSAD